MSGRFNRQRNGYASIDRETIKVIDLVASVDRETVKVIDMSGRFNRQRNG